MHYSAHCSTQYCKVLCLSFFVHILTSQDINLLVQCFEDNQVYFNGYQYDEDQDHLNGDQGLKKYLRRLIQESVPHSANAWFTNLTVSPIIFRVFQATGFPSDFCMALSKNPKDDYNLDCRVVHSSTNAPNQ